MITKPADTVMGNTILTFMDVGTSVVGLATTADTDTVCFLRVNCPLGRASCYLNRVLLYKMYECMERGTVELGLLTVALNCSIDDEYVVLLTIR